MADQITTIQEATKTSRYRRRLNALRSEQTYWRPHWLEIVDNVLPRRGRYLRGMDVTQDNDGRKKHQKVIKGTATKALYVEANGMMAGTTSPSHPWIALGLPDPDLEEYGPVREWLHLVTTAILRVLAMSNYYQSRHYGLSEKIGFGTFAMSIDEDEETVIRCRPFTIGEYCLTLDSRYRPESLYRQFMMTAGQIREFFCNPSDPYSINENQLPPSIKTALASKNFDQRFQVVNVMEKCSFVQDERYADHGKTFRSVYFPYGEDENCILRDQGLYSRPFIAPRWHADGVDTYGSSPTMDGLGDIKGLQKLQLDFFKAFGKFVDPPMNGPTSMKGTGGSIASGATNWIDVTQGQQSFSPAYQINPDMDKIQRAIDVAKREVQEWYHYDFFLGINENAQPNETAFAIARKNEELLRQLGPVLEREQIEDLGPTIERVFSVMLNNNLIPTPPQELPAGMPMKIKYIGILAQAQKMIGLMPIEQTFTFAMGVSKLNPHVIDGLDCDEAISQYANLNGTPPKIVRDAKARQVIRDQNAKQLQMQQAMEAAKAMGPAAGAVNSLANAPTNGGTSTALDQMMKGMPQRR